MGATSVKCSWRHHFNKLCVAHESHSIHATTVSLRIATAPPNSASRELLIGDAGRAVDPLRGGD